MTILIRITIFIRFYSAWNPCSGKFRELSTLQSILQNQVEQFGTHFFKEGSKVIPGNLSYDNNYQCIELEDTFLGIPVELYQDQLQGLRITGLRSGVTATVRRVLSANDSERGSITLYVKYEKSSDDFVTEKFFDGESLTTDKDIVYGLSVIAAGESFANTIAFGATSTGSACRLVMVYILSEVLLYKFRNKL